jgi:hypothetical protein
VKEELGLPVISICGDEDPKEKLSPEELMMMKRV